MKKRFLTLILVLALLLSCLPFAAAQEAPQEEPAVDAVPVEEVTVPAEADLAPVGDADIPVITSAAVAADGVKLTYTPYEGAARYFLFIQKPDGAGWKKIGSATETTFIHKNPVNNTTYIYTVRAADKTGAFISGYDKVGLSFTYFSAPVLKKIESVYGGQRISWNANDGAAFYRVYIKANGAWTALADTAATSYTNKNVVSGTSYTYTVRCLSGEKKLLSYFDKKGLKGVYVAAPTITSFTPVSGGTKIGWKKEDGAVMYRLFYQGASGWKKIADTSGTEYIHSSLTAGTVYKYTVRALDNNGSFISGYNTVGWSFKYIAPIEITSVKKVDAGTQLGWTAQPTAAGYRIYRKPFGGSWTSIGTSNTAKFTDTGAKANTLYAYTLRTLDANGKLTSYFLSNTPYCYNGAIANGKITVNGSSITFKNGYPCKGYVTMGGKMYYYNADGVIQKNGLVGSKSEGYRYADQNGVIQLDYTGIATNANGTWYLYDACSTLHTATA